MSGSWEHSGRIEAIGLTPGATHLRQTTRKFHPRFVSSSMMPAFYAVPCCALPHSKGVACQLLWNTVWEPHMIGSLTCKGKEMIR
eukprot:5763052-Amphidinium_carterae.1